MTWVLAFSFAIAHGSMVPDMIPSVSVPPVVSESGCLDNPGPKPDEYTKCQAFLADGTADRLVEIRARPHYEYDETAVESRPEIVEACGEASKDKKKCQTNKVVRPGKMVQR